MNQKTSNIIWKACGLTAIGVAALWGGARYAPSLADLPAHATVTVKPKGSIQKVPASIAADMSKDVTDKLNAFIKSVPDDSTIVFPKDAKYLIEGTVLVANKNNLTIDGQGALFRSKKSLPDYPKGPSIAAHKKWLSVRNRAHWRIKDSSNITIKNLEVFGPHKNAGRGGTYDANREAQHAFDVSDVHGLTIENANLHNFWGDGVYLSGKSDKVVIRNCKIHATGRQGIAVAVAHDILIENNTITDVRRGLIDIEPYGKKWASGDVRIIGNHFGNSRLLALPMGGGGSIGMVLVAGNTFNGGNGVPLVYNKTGNKKIQRGPFLFVNNRAVIGGSPAPALQFGRVQGIFVAGNILAFPGFRGMTAISVRDGNAGIFGNVFAGAKQVSSRDKATFVLARSDKTSPLTEHDNVMPKRLASVHDYFAAKKKRKADAAAGKKLASAFDSIDKIPASTTVKKIKGGYAVETKMPDDTRAIAVVRSGDISKARELTAFGLSTNSVMAWVYVKKSKVVKSYVMDKGKFTYSPAE